MRTRRPEDRSRAGHLPNHCDVDARDTPRCSRRKVAQRSPRCSIAGRQEVPRDDMPLLRRTRTVMKDRAEYAQKGIARGRSSSHRCTRTVRESSWSAENPSRTLHRSPRSTIAVAFAGSESTTSSTSFVSRNPPCGHKGYAYPARRRRALFGESHAQHLGQCSPMR